MLGLLGYEFIEGFVTVGPGTLVTLCEHLMAAMVQLRKSVETEC